MMEEEVYSLDIMDHHQGDMETSTLQRIELYPLSDRYLCMAVPPAHRSIRSMFTQLLLIDLSEKKGYPIPEPIGDRDSFLRLAAMQCFDVGDTKYLILNTGRILSFEKERLWQSNQADPKFTL